MDKDGVPVDGSMVTPGDAKVGEPDEGVRQDWKDHLFAIGEGKEGEEDEDEEGRVSQTEERTEVCEGVVWVVYL